MSVLDVGDGDKHMSGLLDDLYRVGFRGLKVASALLPKRTACHPSPGPSSVHEDLAAQHELLLALIARAEELEARVRTLENQAHS